MQHNYVSTSSTGCNITVSNRFSSFSLRNFIKIEVFNTYISYSPIIQYLHLVFYHHSIPTSCILPSFNTYISYSPIIQYLHLVFSHHSIPTSRILPSFNTYISYSIIIQYLHLVFSHHSIPTSRIISSFNTYISYSPIIQYLHLVLYHHSIPTSRILPSLPLLTDLTMPYWYCLENSFSFFKNNTISPILISRELLNYLGCFINLGT